MLNKYTLRNWKPEDLPDLLFHGNNPKIAQNMSDSFPSPYSEDAGLKFITFANEDGKGRIFCIDCDGKAIGGIGLHPLSDIFHPSVELGYWLGEDFWGRGIVSKLIPEVLAIAFSNPEVERVFARTMGRNKASQQVLIKAGFKFEYELKGTIRKLGKLEDEVVFGFLRANIPL